MVNRDNLDRLEEIFREKFQEPPYDIPKEWNEPSDAVWENIEQELDDNSKSKRFFYWYALAGFLLLLGTYFLNQQQGSQNILVAEETVAKTNVSVSPSQDDVKLEVLEEKNLNPLSSTTIKTEKTVKAQSSISNNERLVSNSLPKVQSIAATQNSINRHSNLNQIVENQSTLIRNNAKNQLGKINNLPVEDKKQQRKFGENASRVGFAKTYPGKLNGSPFQAKYNTDLQNTLELNQVENEKAFVAKKKVRYGFLAGALNPNQKISTTANSFKYGKNEGRQFGGFAQLSISDKISIEGGVNYSKMNFSGLSKAQTKLEFKEISEGFDIITFQSKHNLATPLGTLPVDYTIKRSNNYFAKQVAEDPIANIKLEQSIQQVTIPVSMQYSILDTKGFALKTNGGLTTRYTANHNSHAELISTELKEGVTTSSEILYKNSGANIKKFDFNPHVGLEISKKFQNSDLQFSIEPFVSISRRDDSSVIATPGAKSYGLNIKISK